MVAVIAAALILSPTGPTARPAWLDRTLAGYALASSEHQRPICVHDKRSGYFLVRDIECDGGSITVVLTRDRKELSELGVTMPGTEAHTSWIRIVEKPLPSLSTGKGIQIGDSEATVTRLLGRPTKRSIEGSRGQFRVARYQWTEKDDQLPTEYVEAYTFKAGRLIEVNFSKSSE